VDVGALRKVPGLGRLVRARGLPGGRLVLRLDVMIGSASIGD
jgi:hypothetical protein